MLQTFRNAFKIPELRKKLLFTLFIILIYRLGAVLPVPFVSAGVMDSIISSANGSIFQYMNILSGDAFSKATLFALAVSPYITASIVMQLLAIAIPALERLSKSEDGQKKINNITRFVTVGLGLVTSFGYYRVMLSYGALTAFGQTFFGGCVIVACYCAGAAMIMWLAEKINESGIGNGISMILFANILARVPTLALSVVNNFIDGIKKMAAGDAGAGILESVLAIVSVVATIAVVVFVVFVTESERKIPVQYAKRVVGRKMYGGQNSVLPIKLNMSGVMPIIFASSIVSLPATITSFFNPKEGGFWDSFTKAFSYTSPLYSVIYLILIVAFSYFYIAISFNPVEVSNNLKKNGGFIPGIRPGKPTSDYITKILSKITLIGAIFLSIVAVLPLIINMILVATGYTGFSGIAFGGNSLLIVVGVAIETQREIEAQMTMRHYKGFLD